MNKLLSRLVVVLGPPESLDPKAFMAEYGRLLAKYTESELDAGGDLLLTTRRSSRWPSISECIGACEDARGKLAAPDAIAAVNRWDVRKRDAEERVNAWNAERLAEADGLIQCEMGIRAAHEGWMLGLWDYCRNHRKLPGQLEIAALVRESRRFEMTAIECEVGRGGVAGMALLKLANAMRSRRARKEALAIGESAA